jgi:hypothetical protein
VFWRFGVLAFWLLVSARCGFACGFRRSGCLAMFGGLGWLGLALVCIYYLRKTSLFRPLSSSSLKSLIRMRNSHQHVLGDVHEAAVVEYGTKGKLRF